MSELCERCGKIADPPHIINPTNNPFGFSNKRTILCSKCKQLWHMAFAIVNHGNTVVENVGLTKDAWDKFMLNGKERVSFT